MAVSLLQTTGTADAKNGLRANFDGYIFDAEQGFENGFAVEDGNTIGLLTEIDLPIETDLLLFDGAYDAGSGVVGIYYGISGSQPPNRMPSSGTANWTGNGFAKLISGTGTIDFGVGSSSVTANFAGTLSVEISELVGSVDFIDITNLTISDYRFSGTNVQTFKSGELLEVVGPNATADVDGVFSGLQNSIGVPDEVGGLFNLTGDGATLVGGFVAD